MSDRSSRPGWIRRLVIATTIAAAGCGNLTVGGFGEVTVSVSGDATTTASAAASPTPAAFAPVALGSRDDAPEGEIEAEFDLVLLSESGVPLRLNEDEIRVRLDLRGRNEIDVVEKAVEATRYSELRIVFTEIRAEVESGLVINGVPVTGEIRVELKNSSIQVTRPIALNVRDAERIDLLIDLNAAAWLQAVDPRTRVVDPSVFASRIGLVIR